MPLSPDEIQSQEFAQAKQGYDKSEVRAFLTTVATDYRDALRLGNYEAVGEEVGKILQTVNDSATALRAKANAEAEEIMSQAKAMSTELREAANAEAAKVKNQAEVETQALRDHTNSQLKTLVSEAEQRVVEMEAKVRKETEERIRAADLRVDALQQVERDLRGRLDRAREMLDSITEQLGDGSSSNGSAPETEAVSLDTGDSEPASTS